MRDTAVGVEWESERAQLSARISAVFKALSKVCNSYEW